jgi:predicted protein tyrosine phosphatase
MIFWIASRKEAEKHAGDIDTPHILISITDYGAPKAIFGTNEYRQGLLRVKFDDVDSKLPGQYPITDADAAAIAKFVDFHKDKINLIVVHCEGGISRSSATAAAIAFFLDRDASNSIFKDKRYMPNMLVFRKVLEAFLERGYNAQ